MKASPPWHGARERKEEEEGTANVNHTRFKEAKATSAKTLAVGCPFCMTMLEDGIKDKGKDEERSVKDIAEIVAQCLSL